MAPTDSVADASRVFLLISPLADWNGQPQRITDGMEIRRLLPAEKSKLQDSNILLHHHEIGGSARDSYWLCYEFENSHPFDDVRRRRRQEAALKLMLHAMYSIQILAPIGGSGVFLLFQKTEAGLILESIQRRQALLGTIWSRACNPPASFPDEIGAVLDRVREAFQKPILRLQIPVWLLEQGMAAPDRHIRILLWATGLDGITRSGGTAAFAERLCELLGADSRVFPPNAAGHEPKYRVAEVVEDLYLLRNEMAHGLPFHEKFRKTQGFLRDDGQPIAPEFANYRYDRVLEECAIFLLCRSLREVLLRNLAFDAQSSSWREQD